MVKIEEMEKTLGKCECIHYSHKYLILRVFKETIEHQKDAINRVESRRKEIIKEGKNPDRMIATSRKFIETVENTKKAVQDIPLCK